MDRVIAPADGYFDRVLKCVPVEVTAVYVLLLSAATTAFDGATLRWWTFVLFLFGVVGTPAYGYLALGVRSLEQLAMTTLAFLVVVAIGGGWLATFSWWSGFYPLLVTVVFGVAVALLDFGPPRPRPARRRGAPVVGSAATSAPDTRVDTDSAAGTPPAPRDAAVPAPGSSTATTPLDEDSALLRIWRGVDPPGSVRP